MEYREVKTATREVVLAELGRYFDIRELVCSHVYNVHKNNSWQFFSTDALRLLLWVRLLINKPLTVNGWHKGASGSQRGLRCNLCQLVRSKSSVYVSAHMLGCAFDIICGGMSAAAMRKEVDAHKNELPCAVVRVEDDVTWLHIDCRAVNGVSSGVYHFRG